MKKLFKSIIAAMLIAVIAVSTFGGQTAQAAETPVIKVTFNKKSVKLEVTDTGVKETKYNTLKKKLGKATSVKNETKAERELGYYYTNYIWKKDKSQFSYNTESFGSSNFYSVSITDKNISICGVTKGTKAKTAQKAFEEAGAEIYKTKDFMRAKFNDKCKVECTLKNGKIIKIYASLYY